MTHKTRPAPFTQNFTQDRERGSIFFYILLAVVLFGALAFTVSRGMRSQQTSTISKRQAQIAASEIIDYGQSIERAINKMRQKGCSENEISFRAAQPYLDGTYGDEQAPTDYSCHVFHPNGGNINLPTQFNDNYFTCEPTTCLGQEKFYRYPEFGGKQAVGDIGTAEPELYLLLGNLKREVCLAINKALGIENPSNKPPSNYGTTYTNSRGFSGTFSSGTGIGVSNKHNGCVADGGEDGRPMFYYHVLIER